MTAVAMSEADLQRCVIDYAQLRGWLVHHCRPAQRQSGRWSTPIQGTPGFPDLVLAHRTGWLVFAELKRDGRMPGPQQQRWLEPLAALEAVTGGSVRYEVWRPAEWRSGQIRTVLDLPLRPSLFPAARPPYQLPEEAHR